MRAEERGSGYRGKTDGRICHAILGDATNRVLSTIPAGFPLSRIEFFQQSKSEPLCVTIGDTTNRVLSTIQAGFSLSRIEFFQQSKSEPLCVIIRDTTNRVLSIIQAGFSLSQIEFFQQSKPEDAISLDPYPAPQEINEKQVSIDNTKREPIPSTMFCIFKREWINKKHTYGIS